MTTIYLVRHAHAEWTPDDDRPLSPAGREAAAAIAALLAAEPVAAVYSSPFRRAVETVAPLAAALGLTVECVQDLRERHVPPVPADQFLTFMEQSWQSPHASLNGAETSHAAQTRGLSALWTITDSHPGAHVVIGTHGNLLALILTALDAATGYEFWRGLSLPDVYRLQFDGRALISIDRMWQPLT